jgi:hypothetical protein
MDVGMTGRSGARDYLGAPDAQIVTAQFATSAPPPPDVLPLLPQGSPLFHSLPGDAVVLEALAPAVKAGIIVSRRRESAGVALVRGGAITECLCIDGGARTSGLEALQRMSQWRDSLVSAAQLSVAEISVVHVFLRGDPLHDDLQLRWVEWGRLLTDLRRSPGAFVVELTTPAGRGVTSIREGTHVATYSDQHVGPGDPTMLDELARGGQGLIRVFRGGLLNNPVPLTAAASLSQPQVADVETPVLPEPIPADVAHFSEYFGMRQQPVTSDIDSPATAAEPAPATVELAELFLEVKTAVRNSLQMASPRVEILLDDAVAAGCSLACAALQIRTMTIRGVQRRALERLTDDILALLAERREHELVGVAH